MCSLEVYGFCGGTPVGTPLGSECTAHVGKCHTWARFCAQAQKGSLTSSYVNQEQLQWKTDRNRKVDQARAAFLGLEPTGGCQGDSSMHASGNWIQQKDEQMLLSFSAFDFCVSGSALCPKAAFLAISSQKVMILLSKEKQSTGCQGNALLRCPAPRPDLVPWPW